jgi:hypothetical protein
MYLNDELGRMLKNDSLFHTVSLHLAEEKRDKLQGNRFVAPDRTQ